MDSLKRPLMRFVCRGMFVYRDLFIPFSGVMVEVELYHSCTLCVHTSSCAARRICNSRCIVLHNPVSLPCGCNALIIPVYSMWMCLGLCVWCIKWLWERLEWKPSRRRLLEELLNVLGLCRSVVCDRRKFMSKLLCSLSSPSSLTL